MSVFYWFFGLSVKINTQLAACQSHYISVGAVNRIRAVYSRNRSIPDRATEISFDVYWTVHHLDN